MTVDTKEVVTTIAYMIGVRMSALTVSYGECSELIEKLRADRDATTIRYLCKLRTVLMQKFKKTDDLMRYQIKNLYNIEWYDHDNIKQLEKWGFTIIQANYRSDKYMQDLTKLINENIDKCSHLFYDWLNWEYIRDLFFVPKYNKNGVHQIHDEHRTLPVSDVYSLAACRCGEHRLFRPQVPEDHLRSA